MKKVYIISAQRTPIGSFGGKLSHLSATQLGTIAIEGALKKAHIPHSEIEEVMMGNVVSANLGQAPARQAALGAQMGTHVPCTTINKVCASGMKAVMYAAQSIMLGHNEGVVAGGMESMSNIPYYIPKARFGYKYGHGEMVDGLLKDGLWEVYNGFPMGNCAENTAKEMNISRAEQDQYAIETHKRATLATQSGGFQEEIIPIQVESRRGIIDTLDQDEELEKMAYDKVPNLPTVFLKKGTVTVANASSINDGAAALVLASEQKVKEWGVTPIAEILGFADAAEAPLWFTTAPSLAIPKALKNAQISEKEVDFYEINEAFSVVALANIQKLQIDKEKVNVMGGAVALGHPLGASGARIIATLCSILKQKNGQIGVAGICNGGGGASALVVKKV